MIYDVILYNGEEDMLKCHLYSTRGVVDLSIVIENRKTFRGESRDYSNHVGWMLDYGEVSYFLSDLDEGNAWETEAALRQEGYDIAIYLGALQDDMLLMSDTDEIPNAKSLLHSFSLKTLSMQHHVFNVNWMDENPMSTSLFGPLSAYEDPGRDRIKLRSKCELIKNGGWHLSWFGTPEERKQKALSYSHTEYSFLAEGDTLEWMAKTGLIWDNKQLVENSDMSIVPEYIQRGNAPKNWFEKEEHK